MSAPRKPLLAVLAATLLLLVGSHATAAPDVPPNIVLLIGDDHGWPYSGFMGDPFVQTPNLDALAAEGTVFRNAQSPSSICQPALRALLAAVHSNQWDGKRAALRARLGPIPTRTEVAHFRTLPRELARRGYLSWEGGKLWEGTFAQAGFTHGLATAVSTNPFVSIGDHFGRDGWSDGTTLDPLRSFLDEAGSAPFFAWIAPLLPHVPYDAAQQFRAPYEQLGLSAREVAYYANVSWLDSLVGALLAELDARGLRENTLIVYVSDNGLGITQLTAGVGRGKGTLYELGFRSPLVLNWPGHVPAGVLRDDLVSTLDVPATLLDYAGADQLGDGDARSIKDAVQSGSPVGREKIVSRYLGSGAENTGSYVRTPSWRYIVADDGREELYEIAIDPFEQLDVAALHPELLPGFRADVAAWQQQTASAHDELDAAGRLTDAQGVPVAGEELQLFGRASTGKTLRLSVLTSSRGDYLFESVPQGAYTLRSRRRSARLAFAQFTSKVPLILPVGTLGSFMEIRATQDEAPPTAGSSTIRGVLRSRWGVPIGAATIAVRGRAPLRVSVAVRSAPDGSYRAENLPPGLYRITVNAGPGIGRAFAVRQLGAAEDATLDLRTSDG